MKTQQQLDEEAGIHNTTGYDRNSGSRIAGGTVDLYGKFKTDPYANGTTPAVTPFTETAGVISSKDDSARFKSDSTKFDGILAGMNGALNDAQIAQLEKLGYREGDVVPNKGRLMPDGTFDKTALTGAPSTSTPSGINELGKPIDNTETKTGSGDPIYDKLTAWQKEQDAKFEADAVVKKQAYEALYNTSLASIDASAQATINTINSTYDQRITEQKRINQLNVDRMKAYGLGSANALYNPIEYTDSVSLREEEASTKIKSLDNERNNLIAQAKTARDSGSSKLLRDKLGDLDKIDEQIRTQLHNVVIEADRQYTLLKNIRKDEETKHKEARAKMVERLTMISPKYSGEYSKMDNNEKDAFIEQVVRETGLDYATVFSTLNKSVSEAQTKLKTDAKDVLLTEKATLDIAVARNNLAKSKKELTDGKKTTAQKEEEAMKSSLPSSFKNEDEAKTKRDEYVRKYGKKGAEHWDSVFYRADSKDNGAYTYPIKKEGSSSPEERAIKAGYNYSKMKEKFTDAQIEEALRAKGI